MLDAFGMLEQVRALMGDKPPRVRFVTDTGCWATIEPDGSRVLRTPEDIPPPLPWRWDGAAPKGDAWVIIYCAGTPIGDGAKYGEAEYGSGARFGLDFGGELGADFLERLRPVVHGVRFVIFAFNDHAFNPDGPEALLPDGQWGRAHKVINGCAVPARPADARFWNPSEER